MEHERGGMNADQGAPRPNLPPIRVALVGCSGVLGDIIRLAVREAPDMRVVSEAPSFLLPGDTDEPGSEADVVLWNNADEEQLKRLLADAAAGQPPVLTAMDDGRKAVLWRLTPHRTALGVLSPDSLVEWIRSAALHTNPQTY